MDNEEIRYIKPNISVEDRTVVIQGTIKINKIPDKNYELIFSFLFYFLIYKLSFTLFHKKEKYLI